ncbi:oxidoreductase [Carbonactinospora thermoautotrophica]|uniref:Oxidoreductase n=1 Tax=Carbonactinospora thermoautotrophica TaxID=1469144 RepID=A0A132MLV7_9ACTN|nr:oxidoreductase [Carbonactinospora thermoautotrophica]KWW97505.1 oxidoreductase [Carbonactinospora thermoautotrophica]KWW98806.1 hypothetical protein LI90_435 [Carbonactinospora thermoautotrophica]
MAQHPFSAVAGLPGVADAVAEARALVDQLLSHRVLRRRSSQVSAESALRGARASAALDGADWSLEEIRRRTNFANEPSGLVVEGALRVFAEFGQLLRTWEKAPLQVLARLHVLAAAGLAEPERLGRPRLPGEPVAGPPELGEPPAPVEVSARLNQLADLLVRDTLRDSAVPALVVAALVHGEVLALRPFPCANGVVARAAQRLVLISRGLDPKGVSVPEAGHYELGSEAYAAAARQYMSGTPDGVAAWVRHCAAAVGIGAREGLAVCEALQRG